MTNDKLFKRKVESNEIITPDLISVSDYLLPGTEEQLSELPSNNYLLCIGYTRYKNKDDFQIGITGALKKGETVTEAAKREGHEEAGIIFNNANLSKIVKYKKPVKKNLKEVTCSIFTVEAKNCSIAKEILHSEKKSDVKTQKITLLIYGPKQDILNLIMASPISINNNDGITHFVAVKVSEALNISKMINKTSLPIPGIISSKRWYLKSEEVLD